MFLDVFVIDWCGRRVLKRYEVFVLGEEEEIVDESAISEEYLPGYSEHLLLNSYQWHAG